MTVVCHSITSTRFCVAQRCGSDLSSQKTGSCNNNTYVGLLCLFFSSVDDQTTGFGAWLLLLSCAASATLVLLSSSKANLLLQFHLNYKPYFLNKVEFEKTKCVKQKLLEIFDFLIIQVRILHPREFYYQSSSSVQKSSYKTQIRDKSQGQS